MNDSREHILNVSLQLFLRNSFKDVTMKEIVEQTGLSKGAFYHYFNSKEQVFEEVIRYFFEDFIHEDYQKHSQESLSQFIRDLLQSMDAKMKSARIILQSKDQRFNTNHYYLLFDALKLLPGFKDELLQYQKEEQKAWIRAISSARRQGEVHSPLPDEQLAKLFICASDGLGIKLILQDDMGKMRKELQQLWENIYSMLKKN